MLARSVSLKEDHDGLASPRFTAACASLLLLVTIPAFVRAGSTDPTLAIGQVSVRPAGAASVVEVSGIFGFDDLLQVSFPLNLVVFQGTTFVRYPVGGAPESGTFAGLGDGLQTDELSALESAGVADPGAELLRLRPQRLLAALPTSIGDGTVTVVLYVEVPGEGSFLSNALQATLTGVGGAP